MKAQRVLAVLSVAFVAAVSAQQCGRRNSYSVFTDGLQAGGSNYVVGGERSLKNEFPWQVSLQVVVRTWWSSAKAHTCGGSIISDRWIVTAAHCINAEFSMRDYRVVAGAQFALRPESTQQERRVERIIIHPQYNQVVVQNDIALIKLDRPFDLSQDSVAPICLPKSTDARAFDGKICTATGWGALRHGGQTSPVLMKVDLPVVSNAICQSRYRSVRNASLNAKMLCAGFLAQEGSGVCQGDSGGPFACEKDGVYYLAGLTSFGVICGSKDFPAVFTRLSAHRQWIDANID